MFTRRQMTRRLAFSALGHVPTLRYVVALGLLLGMVACNAAAPVVESKGQPRTQSRASSTDQSGAAANRNSDSEDGGASAAARGGNLVFEVQALRQQVLELRGQLEEQNHRLERMEKEQRERYLDVDRRLRPSVGADATGAVSGAAVDAQPRNGGEPALQDNAGAETSSTDNRGIETKEPAIDSGEPGERAAYAKAVQLTRGKNYEAAIAAFNQQLTDFPGGAFEANAFYWLGELYLALPQPQLERARQAFAQVVNLYPENAKVPDALYKLAIVYDKLGDPKKAHDYMVRVRDEHAGTTAASLASTYLSGAH